MKPVIALLMTLGIFSAYAQTEITTKETTVKVSLKDGTPVKKQFVSFTVLDGYATRSASNCNFPDGLRWVGKFIKCKKFDYHLVKGLSKRTNELGEVVFNTGDYSFRGLPRIEIATSLFLGTCKRRDGISSWIFTSTLIHEKPYATWTTPHPYAEVEDVGGNKCYLKVTKEENIQQLSSELNCEFKADRDSIEEKVDAINSNGGDKYCKEYILENF